MNQHQMRVQCVCGHDKPHGQICWLRTEFEVPFENNDEHYIEAGALQRHIPLCRSCFKRYIQACIKKDSRSGADTSGAKLLLEILRKRKPMSLVDDEENPTPLNFVCRLLCDLRGPDTLEELAAMVAKKKKRKAPVAK